MVSAVVPCRNQSKRRNKHADRNERESRVRLRRRLPTGVERGATDIKSRNGDGYGRDHAVQRAHKQGVSFKGGLECGYSVLKLLSPKIIGNEYSMNWRESNVSKKNMKMVF